MEYGQLQRYERHGLRDRPRTNYQANLTDDSDPINWDAKLDWNISNHDLATFRVDYQHIINTFPAPLGPVLDGTGSYQGHNQSYLSENLCSARPIPSRPR